MLTLEKEQEETQGRLKSLLRDGLEGDRLPLRGELILPLKVLWPDEERDLAVLPAPVPPVLSASSLCPSFQPFHFPG